jgi:hypothetical protein
MANYRQQTASALGASTACATCFGSLQLKYATTEVGLCCATVTATTYYVAQGQTFANATAIFDNAALTVRSANGYYGV